MTRRCATHYLCRERTANGRTSAVACVHERLRRGELAQRPRWKLTWRSRARWLPPKCRRSLRPAVALGEHPSRARGRQQQPTKRSNRPKCAPVPETAEAAARLPSVLMASGLRAACESAAMRWLRCQLTWCGRESLHRTSKLLFHRHSQPEALAAGRLLCFDPS